MKILSIDQSTKNVGYCVFNNADYVKSGTIQVHKPTQKKKYEYEFVDKSFLIIATLINEHSPDVIVMEEVFAGKSNGALKLLATLKGMVIGYCRGIGINTEVIYPTSWKSFLKVHSKRDKEKVDVKNFFQSKYNLVITEDDESDAIGIGYYYVKKYL